MGGASAPPFFIAGLNAPLSAPKAPKAPPSQHRQPGHPDQREFSPPRGFLATKIPVPRCAVIAASRSCPGDVVGCHKGWLPAAARESGMAIIGTFKRAQHGFDGTIETLTCAPAPVRISAIRKANDQAPDHRVYRGVSEIGAAWTKTARSGRDYLIVVLDDPAFAKPIQGRLIEVADGFHLVWSRD
jgi:uncharacterized protein (DUF736 family)